MSNQVLKALWKQTTITGKFTVIPLAYCMVGVVAIFVYGNELLNVIGNGLYKLLFKE